MEASGYITFPIMLQPPAKSNIASTAKNYTESNGMSDLQMLGYALSKSCQASQLLGIGEWAGPAQSKLLYTVVRDKVPVVHLKHILRKSLCIIPASGRGKSICGTAFTQGHGCTSWVMWKNGEVDCVPQRELILDENTKLIKLYSVN